MGDKIRSRAFAASAGVPTPRSVSLSDDADLERAAQLGFPLLVKASAGGGGKGMRVVRSRDELAASVALARGEATRYFGDGRLSVERLVERPRHVEVQVLGDGRGGAVHLGERECSIQRRYQKIVEESPAPHLDPVLRARILDAALTLARASRYENAGTVEFIVDEGGSFQFLEMNTRLQVEHPVTEMVTGVDLVLDQLRIAASKTLPAGREDVVFRGHAIECRICAEEPEHGFRPATGTVGLLRLPRGEGIRVENGICEGQAVTSAFDSLLMKVVAHGATREEAIGRMRRALSELVILGVPTNVDFLARLVGSDVFRAGRVHTGLLDVHPELLVAGPPDDDVRPAVLASAALVDPRFRRLAFDVPEPWASMGAFRN
jgi:propionyl-CoA carboxylase alpha chain/3-methylcrotonyl-CoA carboxylase alpha subunit/acetyl-CoA/propionyl-CoA carboxylase biotin carboxyl carrier protein